MWKFACIAGCLLLVGAPARAAPDEDPAEAAATAVEVAAPTKVPAELRVACGQTDPWVVVDVLHGRGRVGEATALADAVEGPDVLSLRSYAGHPPREPSGARERLAKAEAARRREAYPAAVEALEGGENLPDGVLRVRWLGCRGRSLSGNRWFQRAAEDLRSAAEVAERLGWRTEAASLWKLAGRAYVAEHDRRAATDAWRHLADLQRALGDTKRLAMTLADLGTLARASGDLRGAVSLFDQALAADKDGTAEVRAEMLAYRAAAWRALGEYARAFADLSTAGELLGVDEAAAVARIRVLDELAMLFIGIGDRAQARATAEAALRHATDPAVLAVLARRGRKEERRQPAVARALVGQCDLEESAFGPAAAAFVAAREEFLAIDDRSNAACALQNLGEVRLREARWPEARALSLSAAAEFRDVDDVAGALRADGNRGEAEEGMGRRNQAEGVHLATLEEAERRGYRVIVLEQAVRVARIRLLRGDFSGALEAVERGFQVLTGVFGGLGDAERVGARDGFGPLFETGVRAALARGDDAQVFRYLEAGRAGALLDALGNRDALRARRVDPALEKTRAEAERDLADARDALARSGDVRAAVKGAMAALQKASGRHEAAVREIQRRDRGAAYVLYPQPDRLQDVAAALPPEDAIVEYSTVGDASVAFVVTHAGARRVLLTPSKDVAALDDEEAWRVKDASKGDARAAADAAIERARLLLWKPVVDVLPATVQRVYVSPDRTVRRVPFGAFVGGERRLSVSFVPSATTLAILRADGARRGKEVLAFGVSKYAASAPASGGLFRGRYELGDLPAAADDASAVGDQAVVDDDATEAELWRRASSSPRWSAVHFACHGIVDLDSPSLSSIALRPGEGDDGYVTALELFQMDLPTDLVTLSACDTGWGEARAGEGVVALVRAFLFAGTPRVVATLWPVEDRAASLFTRAFYAAWKAGKGAAVALAAGVAAVRAEPRYDHPKFWAPWVLWGLQD